jgi:hypothetical protein
MSQKNVPAFFTSPEFDQFMRKSFAAHRANEAEAPEIHLYKKHVELESSLNTKTLLYLDTNHWIHLRDVVLKKSQERLGYREILELLKILREQQRICCPISFALFLELMKQSDPNTRLPKVGQELWDLFPQFVAHALYREQPEEIFLRQLFVARNRRRKGIGREAFEILRTKIWPKNKRLTVDVLIQNTAAIAFWRSVGYKDYCLALEILP